MKYFYFLLIMVIVSMTTIILKSFELINLDWIYVMIPTFLTLISSLGFHIREFIKGN